MTAECIDVLLHARRCSLCRMLLLLLGLLLLLLLLGMLLLLLLGLCLLCLLWLAAQAQGLSLGACCRLAGGAWPGLGVGLHRAEGNRMG